MKEHTYLTLKIPLALKEKIDKFSKNEHRSRMGFVLNLVESYIKQREGEPKNDSTKQSHLGQA